MNYPELTVSGLNQLLKTNIESEIGAVTVVGEITNFSVPASAHWYFTLKDEKATIRCCMFKGSQQGATTVPKNGSQIKLQGIVSLFIARGDVQIIAKRIDAIGIGALSQQFEELKKKLESEGLFAEGRKRSIPESINTIALITSSTGAAAHDVLSTLNNRWPLMKIKFYPTLVQGTESIASLVNQINKAGNDDGVDAVLLVRGGGSLEDLWSFNTEEVVRAVANCKKVVISGIGHETDFSICDFVSDYRAETPTAAAVAVSPDQYEVLQYLTEQKKALGDGITDKLDRTSQHIDYLSSSLSHFHPKKIFEQYLNQSKELKKRLNKSFSSIIERSQSIVEKLHAGIKGNNPNLILSKGYAIIKDDKGCTIKNKNQVTPEQPLTAKLKVGQIRISVIK